MKQRSPEEPDNDPEKLLDVVADLEQQNTYALVVKGHSMSDDHIADGDYIVVKPQTTCENGDIVVAVHLVPGGEGQATLKRFFQEDEKVRLQPANSEKEPIFISRSEWDKEWQVQGKVVAIFRQAGRPPTNK